MFYADDSLENTGYKKYNRTKIIIKVSQTAFFFVGLIVMLACRLNYSLYSVISNWRYSELLSFLLFVYILDFGITIILFPVSFYSGYLLEHKYNLTSQKFGAWLKEEAKDFLVSFIVTLPLLLLFYYILHTYTAFWWLPFGIILFFFSVVMAQLFPIVIFPFFHKSVPVENEDLMGRISRLSDKAGVKIEKILSFDMSKSTNKANAMFTGLGKTKRILLGDTLLNNFSVDEIETVIAHELGHYKHKHIIKNLFTGTFVSFFSLFLIASVYAWALKLVNPGGAITDTASLPLLLLVAMVLGLIISPLMSGLSRKYEFQADKFAVSETGKHDIFIEALQKLNLQNLGDPDPHPLVEWLFYSHPSIKNRVKAVENLKGIAAENDSGIVQVE
jgi:STE24 endopeptidase